MMKGLLLFALACWLFPPLGAVVTALLGLVWIILQVLAVTAVVAVMAAVAYSTIKDWYEPLTVSGDTVEAFKRELGNHTVVNVGIRSSAGVLKHQKDFEGDTLADDLKAKFAGQDKIILKG